MSESAHDADARELRTCACCPRLCRIAPGGHGFCRARQNVDGTVVASNYGRATSLALDPVEKKPLACWKPRSLLLSYGSYGCNFRCPFCQNWQISQAGEQDVRWHGLDADGLVGAACRERLHDRRVVGVAHTYNEPLVGWEFVRDVGRLAHERGLFNVLVSNGCASPWVLDRLDGLVDAANIDLKSLSPTVYERYGGAGSLDAVRATIERLAAAPDCHLEVTTLVVPGENDDPCEIEAMARWLASLDDQIPYHLSRFFPRWRMTNCEPTPTGEVRALARVARRWLRRVFVGNC